MRAFVPDVLHPSFFKAFSEICELANGEIAPVDSGYSVDPSRWYIDHIRPISHGRILSKGIKYGADKVPVKLLDLSPFPHHRIDQESIRIADIFLIRMQIWWTLKRDILVYQNHSPLISFLTFFSSFLLPPLFLSRNYSSITFCIIMHNKKAIKNGKSCVKQQ